MSNRKNKPRYGLTLGYVAAQRAELLYDNRLGVWTAKPRHGSEAQDDELAFQPNGQERQNRLKASAQLNL